MIFASIVSSVKNYVAKQTEFRHLLEESYRHRSNKDSVASERALADRISRAYDKVWSNSQVPAGY
jgi:hypothetical protein